MTSVTPSLTVGSTALADYAVAVTIMKQFDPTTLEIYRALYTSVAEEMGIALRRTAFSPNIKERRDYSCAVFDSRGRVIAQGDHMPVHLGSMPMAVASALKRDRSRNPATWSPSTIHLPAARTCRT